MRTRHRQSLIARAAAAITTALLLTLLLPATAPTAAAGTVAATPAQKPPKVVGKECRGTNGVTVVVDFRNLHNEAGKVMNRVAIGCAKGRQQNGFTALTDAGFEVDPNNPFVCEIDDRPLPEDSVCASRGYWSYWHAGRDTDWEFSGVGPRDWTPSAGSLEGWSWSPYDKDWAGPRVTPGDLFGGSAASPTRWTRPAAAGGTTSG